MPADIPAATLAAADHADPDWWEACAVWHEGYADSASLGALGPDDGIGARERNARADAHHSAAALACRAFALMMRRAVAVDVDPGDTLRWRLDYDGAAVALVDFADRARTLPHAVADALREEG